MWVLQIDNDEKQSARTTRTEARIQAAHLLDRGQGGDGVRKHEIEVCAVRGLRLRTGLPPQQQVHQPHVRQAGGVAYPLQQLPRAAAQGLAGRVQQQVQRQLLGGCSTRRTQGDAFSVLGRPPDWQATVLKCRF